MFDVVKQLNKCVWSPLSKIFQKQDGRIHDCQATN